jgi:hypothetical protein
METSRHAGCNDQRTKLRFNGRLGSRWPSLAGAIVARDLA